MAVSIRKKGNRWHIRFQKKGKKEVIKSLPGSLQEKTVLRRKNWYEEQISLNRFDPWQEDTKTISVLDAYEEFIEMNKRSGNWSDATYRTNKNVFERMFKNVYDHDVTEIEWQNIFDQHPGNPYSRKSNRGRLNAFLNYLNREGYIKKAKVSISIEDKLTIRNDRTIRYITWEQLDHVCKAHRWLFRQNQRLFTGRDHKDIDFYPDLLWFMFYSLLRRFEVSLLTVQDLKGNKLEVFGKGRRFDTITLPPPALRIAKKYAKGKHPSEPLIVSDMNRPKVHLANAIDLALGPDHHSKGFHQLRHGGIVHYISIGKPIQFISKLARHKSIQITLDTYADVLPDSMEEVFSDVKHEPPSRQND